MESSGVFRNFADAVGGDARFRKTAGLVLLPESDAAAARSNVEMNRELGVDIDRAHAVRGRQPRPAAQHRGIALGVYEPNAGHADPVATTYAFAEQATRPALSSFTGCEVTGIRVSSGRVVGVDTKQAPIDSNTVVASPAPGPTGSPRPWARACPSAPSGFRSSTCAARRPLESLTTIVIDNTTGAFLRVSDGPMSLLGGEAPEDLREAVDPDACDQSAGHDTITDLWARASRRIPAFAAATPWAATARCTT